MAHVELHVRAATRSTAARRWTKKPLAPRPTVVDATHVRLALDGLRAGYVHELHYERLRSASGGAPLHDRAYYTLAVLPSAAAAPSTAGAGR